MTFYRLLSVKETGGIHQNEEKLINTLVQYMNEVNAEQRQTRCLKYIVSEKNYVRSPEGYLTRSKVPLRAPKALSLFVVIRFSKWWFCCTFHAVN